MNWPRCSIFSITKGRAFKMAAYDLRAPVGRREATRRSNEGGSLIRLWILFTTMYSSYLQKAITISKRNLRQSTLIQNNQCNMEHEKRMHSSNVSDWRRRCVWMNTFTSNMKYLKKINLSVQLCVKNSEWTPCRLPDVIVIISLKTSKLIMRLISAICLNFLTRFQVDSHSQDRQ